MVRRDRRGGPSSPHIPWADAGRGIEVATSSLGGGGAEETRVPSVSRFGAGEMVRRDTSGARAGGGATASGAADGWARDHFRGRVQNAIPPCGDRWVPDHEAVTGRCRFRNASLPLPSTREIGVGVSMTTCPGPRWRSSRLAARRAGSRPYDLRIRGTASTAAGRFAAEENGNAAAGLRGGAENAVAQASTPKAAGAKGVKVK